MAKKKSMWGHHENDAAQADLAPVAPVSPVEPVAPIVPVEALKDVPKESEEKPDPVKQASEMQSHPKFAKFKNQGDK